MHHYSERIEFILTQTLHGRGRLIEAMRYGTLGGGKRLRAALVYSTGECFSLAPESLDAAACAVELIHAYSLIHDDLPAMDNDDFRRGKPSNHKAFDEATAILAGDALNTLAFEVLSQSALPDAIKINQIQTLAHAAGMNGMVGGQMHDMQAMHQTLSEAQLTQMHQMKTGALIEACLLLGAQNSPDYEQHRASLSALGQGLGLWYQVQDDVLDCIADSKTLGKTAGKDATQGKNTFVGLWGLKGCESWLLQQQAYLKALCATLPQNGAMLWSLIEKIGARKF